MPLSTLVDLVKLQITSTGTGILTLGAAVPGYRGREALVDGNLYSYSIQQNGNYEVGQGTYLASGFQFVRTPEFSSNGGATIDLGPGAILVFTALSSDFATPGAVTQAQLDAIAAAAVTASNAATTAGNGATTATNAATAAAADQAACDADAALAAASATACASAQTAILAAIAAGAIKTFASTANALSNGVLLLAVTSNGSGGTAGTFTGTFTGGGGSGATFRFTVASGAVVPSSIVLQSPGSGYTSTPTPVFTASSGLTGVAATVTYGANTVDGNYFAVPDTTNGNFLLYKNSTGTAVLQLTVPGASQWLSAFMQLTSQPNLFNVATATTNTILNTSTNVLASVANTFTSDYIPVLPGGTFIMSSGNSGGGFGSAYGIAFFDVAKNWLGSSASITGPTSANTPYTVPAGAAYMRTGFDATVTKGTLGIYWGSTLPTSQKGFGFSDPLTVARQIRNLLYAFPKDVNLFNPARATVSQLVSSTTGNLTATGNSFAASDYMPVIPGGSVIMNLTFPGSSAFGVAFYDYQFNFISGIGEPLAAGTAYSVPSGAGFARVSVITATMGTFFFGNGTTLPTGNFVAAMDVSARSLKSRANAPGIAMGDSIVAGSHTAVPWPTLVGTYLQSASLVNGGQSGTCMRDILSVRSAADFTSVNASVSTGSISGTVLTVSAMAAGALTVGQIISGTGVVPGTMIIALGTGTGGTGTYTVSVSQTVSSTTISSGLPPLAIISTGTNDFGAQTPLGATTDVSSAAIFVGSTSGATLTVTAMVSGTLAVGQTIVGPGVGATPAAPLTITALGTGTGGTGTYTISPGQNVTSNTFYAGPNTFASYTKRNIEVILSMNPATRLSFLTPLHRTDISEAGTSGISLQNYVDMIISIGAMYGTPVYDQYRNSGLGLANFNAATGLSVEGLHPTTAGQALIIPGIGKFLERI